MEQLHSSETFTITDLLTQVAEWSMRNFGDRQASDLGVLEEVGEATHGILKRFQGIRGFDDPDKFGTHMQDAFSDMGIYLLNYAGCNGLLLTLPPEYHWREDATDRLFICNILLHLNQLISFTGYVDQQDSLSLADKDTLGTHLQSLWLWVAMWSEFHGISFLPAVSKTWVKIRTRDWQKNNKDAHLTDGGYQPEAWVAGQETPTEQALRHKIERSTSPGKQPPGSPADLGMVPLPGDQGQVNPL